MADLPRPILVCPDSAFGSLSVSGNTRHATLSSGQDTAQALELGLDTFGDVTRDADGQLLPQAQVIRDVIDEAVLADDLGIDFFGVGEHHRADFAVSAPESCSRPSPHARAGSGSALP
ncbi:MAG: hypothetical protein J2P47_10645 [Acetobacteraceae bacterium]|nr:hypothetical protein [Acetobacteraceae bacterium]